MIAIAGSYQQMLQGKVYQMLRLSLDESLGAIPEISANKYMLWIRFNIPNANGVSKNNPYLEPIQFKIRLCNL